MRLLLATAILSLSFVAQAQSRGSAPLSPDDQKALEDTQEMMRDRKAIDAYTAKNPEAAKADAQARSLMGNQTDATYDLAAEVFGDMVKQSGGDTTKLMQLLNEAQKNPTAFLNKLTPAQRARVKSMAETLESQQAAKPPH